LQVFRRLFCRPMFFIAMLAWILASFSAVAPASPASPSDIGTFEIAIGGKVIGVERFRILPSGNKIVAKAEIELHSQKGGKTLVLHSLPELVLDSQLQPVSYTWAQKGVQNSELRIDFTTVPAKVQYHTVNGKNDYRHFLLPKDVVVLDDNVLNQYEILVDLYNKTSRGQQTFNAFIPQEALPGQVKVVETGIEQVRIGGRSESLRHLVVTTDLAHIELWTDQEGRLQRVSVPAMRFNAVRQN
jgi:hypothetical protein